MKLRGESAENGEFSGLKGEFKKRFSGRNRIELPSGVNIGVWTEHAILSTFAVAGFIQGASYVFLNENFGSRPSMGRLMLSLCR